MSQQAMYTTYVDVPRQPTLEGRLLVKRKGEQWKPRWVVLKGPGLSAYKIIGGNGAIGGHRGPLKLSIDLGKEDATICARPEKYDGLPVFGLKPGKGVPRCFMQTESAESMEQWREAIGNCIRRAQSAASTTLIIPASLRAGQQLHARFRDGTIRRVSVPAGIRPGRQLRVRMYQASEAGGGAAATGRAQGASQISRAMPPNVAARFEHSVDHVVEIAQCDREMAARVLLASRGDVGLAIGRIIESQASGGAETTAARPSELELELGLTDLDSGAQLSPTLLAQQQALLDMASLQRDQPGGEAAGGAAMDLPVALDDLQEGDEGTMEVFLRRQDGSHTALAASTTDTVEALKQRVCKLGLVATLAPDEMRLLYVGKELEDDKVAIADLGIADGATVYFVRKLTVQN